MRKPHVAKVFKIRFCSVFFVFCENLVPAGVPISSDIISLVDIMPYTWLFNFCLDRLLVVSIWIRMGKGICEMRCKRHSTPFSLYDWLSNILLLCRWSAGAKKTCALHIDQWFYVFHTYITVVCRCISSVYVQLDDRETVDISLHASVFLGVSLRVVLTFVEVPGANKPFFNLKWFEKSSIHYPWLFRQIFPQ